MAKTVQYTEAIKEEYKRLLDTVQINKDWESALNRWTLMIQANRKRYEDVSALTGVPWEVIGVIHGMEGGCNFNTHLHNGDPLTAKTVHVPRGRPATGNPPYKWEDSAVDALKLKKLDQVDDWSDVRICYELERYNGFGYRLYHSDVLSPYLWSGTNHYVKGKYVYDGKWDKNAVSKQLGAIPVLLNVRKSSMSNKEVIKNSTKLQTNKKFRQFISGIATTLAGWFTLDSFGAVTAELKSFKEVVEGNALLITLGGLAAFWILLKWFEYKNVQDYEEGRYIPSGVKKEE